MQLSISNLWRRLLVSRRLYEIKWNRRPFFDEFFKPNSDTKKLGHLVGLYREIEDSNKNINQYAKDVDMEADYGKFGLFSCGDAPGALGGGVGAFLWFKDEAAALDI